VRDHGIEAELVAVEDGDDARELDGLPVCGLAEASGRRYDVAIATWWQTAAVLPELDAERRVLLLQSFEQRFYGPEAPFERLGAEAVLALPLDFLAVAPWLRDTLLELRPDASCRVVPNGIDKEVFSGEREPRRDGPLNVLVEGQATLPFKGVRDALAAVRAMREPVRCTVVALDPEGLGDLGADLVLGGLDPAGMARLYLESDVLVKLSRVEGLGLAPVEGFHSGLPCLVTPYTGHEEYAEHGVNGLIVGFDDLPGTTGWLDRLARDRRLLARLSEGALQTARRWPSSARSTELLLEALVALAAGAAPEADVSLLHRTLALHGELGRGRLGRMDALEDALAGAQAHVRELSESREECSRMLNSSREELAAIKTTRSYRAARRVRRALKAVRRR
jgi:glycosyltransferase involved in cell wall biosynthesis